MREESRTRRRSWNTRAVARRVSTSLDATLRPVGDRRSSPAGARCARQAAAPASTVTVPGALRLPRRRRVGVPAHPSALERARVRPAAAVAALPSAGSVRPGARCARSLGRRQLRPFRVRGHQLHRSTACADAAGPSLHLVPGYAAARRRPLRLAALLSPRLNLRFAARCACRLRLAFCAALLRRSTASAGRPLALLALRRA